MALAALAVLIGACAAGLPGSSGGPSGPSGPVPSLPGTPGHFNDGQESFDYPADWPVRGGGYGAQIEYVLAVLGDGIWQDGCNLSNGVACPDTVSVSPGQILVKVFRLWGAFPVPCQGDTQANATFGSEAVRMRVDGAVTTWEIRVPGNEFGSNNNIFIEAHSTDSVQLAKAAAMVASFRWIGPQSGMCDQSGAATATPSQTPLAHYGADRIAFDYPATWHVLSDYQHWGIHGPTIEFAVGTGAVYSGCTVTPPASQGLGGGVACNGFPSAVAGGDQVVVYWYEGAWLDDPGALPTASLRPGESWTSVGGQAAIEMREDGEIRWQLSRVGYIEALWGPGARDAQAQAEALVSSLTVGNP